MIMCQLCLKEFKNNNAMSLHLRNSHPEISKFEYIKKYLYDDDIECPICGKDRKLYRFRFLDTCGDKTCISKSRKKTCINKYSTDNPMKNDEIKEKLKNTIVNTYGVDNYSKTKEYKEKYKKTMLDRYGKDHYSKTDEFKEKYKTTCNERYGVDNYSKSKTCREMVKRTNVERFGVDNPLKSSEIREKIKKTCIDRYGVDHPFKSKEVRNKIHDININKFMNNVKNNRPDLEFIGLTGEYYYTTYLCKWRCKNCDTIFEDYAKSTFNWIHPRCPTCNPMKHTSIENKVYNYLIDVLNEDIKRCTRQVITPYELDLYIPHLNLGIECDGDYWHSDEVMLESRGMTYEDHCILKDTLCKEKNITLLRFTEDKINNEFEKVKEIIGGFIWDLILE